MIVWMDKEVRQYPLRSMNSRRRDANNLLRYIVKGDEETIGPVGEQPQPMFQCTRRIQGRCSATLPRLGGVPTEFG